jgi:hypothetical protein
MGLKSKSVGKALVERLRDDTSNKSIKQFLERESHDEKT